MMEMPNIVCQKMLDTISVPLKLSVPIPRREYSHKQATVFSFVVSSIHRDDVGGFMDQFSSFVTLYII